MERNLALEVVRATEAAALAAARFIGKGDEQMADRVAAEAMRNTLNSIAMDGARRTPRSANIAIKSPRISASWQPARKWFASASKFSRSRRLTCPFS